MMKLWDKDKKTEQEVMQFTIGDDPEFDRLLAPYDVIGSMAHAVMLGETKIIPLEEAKLLNETLAAYYPVTLSEAFRLSPDDEDIHSHLENHLQQKLGDPGKKIHTARSRNDQVMTAMQLMMKEEYRLIMMDVQALFDTLVSQAERYKDVLIPGYTHTQIAMPSSIAIWLGAYAESLVNDLHVSAGIVTVLDQNPLGSAAGYGSSFPIDRELTTKLAGFGELQISSVSPQLNRGKMESLMTFGIGTFAQTMSRLASDMILFMNRDMGFISFRDELTTGSSIMPHKKNPDVLELVRAHCNTVVQMPAMLNSLSANLVSGYHRDFQLTKEILMPAVRKIRRCLSMMNLMVSSMVPQEGILEDEKYSLLFSVEEVNKKVMRGMPFRDAYREVAKEIEEGRYSPGRGTTYTHTGSIGNPGIDRIRAKMKKAVAAAEIRPADTVFKALKNYYSS
jgi:argininosuccinate lyase